MVEKKEFAVTFRKKKYNDEIEEFIPLSVVEGKYDEKCDCFEANDIQYIHIDLLPDNLIGYACRTTIEIMKDSLSYNSIEQIKQEIFNYVEKFTYRRNTSGNNCIVAINKETSDEYLFEDKDNSEEIELKEEEEDLDEIDETLGMTPRELEEEIKKTIKGQDKAVRQIVTALWTTLKFRNIRKKNMLITGPTGVGKTAIFEKIREVLNIPVTIFSVPGLSQAGYIGRNTDEILKQVFLNSGCIEEDAEKSIVILDEIDKIATAEHTGGISTTGVQNELLKIIEGCERYVEATGPYDDGFAIDTSKMIFIATGAFQEIYEEKKSKEIGFSTKTEIQKKKEPINSDKLIKYGLKRELVGRLPILVELDPLGKEELKEIINYSDESELNININALKELGVAVENIEEVIDLIAEDALNKKIGARGLVLTINNILQEIFYEVANNPGKYSKVIIGPNIIKDNTDFKLIKKRNYTKKKQMVAKG